MGVSPRVHTISGGRVLTPAGWVRADLVLEGTRIARVGRGLGAGGREIAATGLLVVPGLIDLQVNGGYGYDFTSAPDAIWSVGALLPRNGVTAFLPTIVSSPPGDVRHALEVLAAGPPAGYRGAQPLGLHCEGPMLSPRRRGAHLARHLRPPSLEVIDGWSAEAGVRMVTLAPELDGARPVIRELRERRIVVSIGHSDATFEQAIEAFDAGVGAGTHLFNAMSGFHHRAPGVVGALMYRADVVAGLIADGPHVHPAAVAAAWRVKGPRGISLVTDAVAAVGVPPGVDISLAGSSLTSSGSEVRDANGVLAGSALTLDRAVRNLVVFAGAAPEEAILAATQTPAALLRERGLGVIEAGACADLVLLDPDLEAVATIVGGEVAFDRRSASGSVDGR
jgi:N-acetylglucosamine-6-phosphate deacetylase